MNRLPRLRLLLPLLLCLGCASRSDAARVARFWLEQTISGERFGPVVNTAGYRFQIGTEGYMVLEAPAGKVLFTTYPETQYLGPFDLESGRILNLGARAYAIVDLDSVPRPQLPPGGLPGVPPSPSPPTPPPTPRTSDGQAVQVEPWTWSAAPPVLTTRLWFEPRRTTRYDWTLGGFTGERASKLEFTRLGGGVAWGSWVAEAGYGFNGRHAKSVIPAGATVSSLRLDNGEGVLLGVGYLRRIALERHWFVEVGGLLEHRNERFDLVATTLQSAPPGERPPTDDPEEPVEEGPRYVYRDTRSSATLRELTGLAKAGIAYDGDAWGLQLDVLIKLFDDTTVSGSVQVFDERHSLGGSRSHPVSVGLTGWCYLLETLRAEASLLVGADTTLRTAIAFEW